MCKQVGSKSSCLRLSLIKDSNDEELMAFVDSYVPFGVKDEEYCTKVFNLFTEEELKEFIDRTANAGASIKATIFTELKKYLKENEKEKYENEPNTSHQL